ncbi:MAG: hypothetical protein RR672_01235 [Raoultibacter sp.]
MFTVEKKTYELKYSFGSIETIEEALGRSLSGILFTEHTMFSMRELKTMIAFACKEVGADGFTNTSVGYEVAEKLIVEKGYTIAASEVIIAFQRDCPFYFLGI